MEKIQFVPLSRRVWVWRKDPKRPWCPFSWVSWPPERRQWVFRMRAHNVRKGKGHPNTDYFHRRQEPNPSTLQWDPPSPLSSKAVGIRLEEYNNKSDTENWKKWSSCHSNIGSQVYDTQKSHFGRKLCALSLSLAPAGWWQGLVLSRFYETQFKGKLG